MTQRLLAISNFNKYIPLNLTGFKGIFACEIKQHANVLKIDVTLYQIKNISLFENISEGLNKNPEAVGLIDAIDKELIFKESVSQMDAIAVKHGFQQQLNEYSSIKPTDSVQMGNYVTLHGIIPNLNNLYLQYEHAYIIYGFFKFFIDNYDTIKMSIIQFKGEKKDEITIDNQGEDVVREEKHKPVNDEMIDDGCSGIFLEMMGVISNQALRVFIARNIFNKNWELDTAVSITKDNANNYIINHHPLYDFNVWQYSSIHNKELINILMNIKEENTFELANKLKQVTKQIIYIMLNEKQLIEKDKSKYIFTVSVGLFLLYIYSLKMMNGKFIESVYTEDTRNSSNYVAMVNYAFRYVLEKFNVNQTSIKSISIRLTEYDSETSNFNPIDSKLDAIFEQYKYLASVDQNDFMNTVFSALIDTEDVKVETASIVDDLTLSLGKPKVIDIKTFIQPKTFNNNELTVESIFKNYPSSMLNYTRIPLNNLFKSNDIISYYYCQMLFLQYNGINKQLLELPSYTSPIIRRYADIIICSIFKEIDANRQLATNAISSFGVYHHFIAPFIKNSSITDYASLLLLYQIAIPHIHNIYGVDKFIDNFH